MDDLDRLMKKQRESIANFDEKLALEEKRLEVALQISNARQKERLTQEDLARKAFISPLSSPDYKRPQNSPDQAGGSF